MIGADLSLASALVDVFVNRDTFDVPDAVADVTDILRDVSDSEAIVFPDSYGRALDFVNIDDGRWRSAADAAVMLDIYEAAPRLLQALQNLRDPHQAANAASLIANPSISDDERAMASTNLLSLDLRDDLKKLLEVRLGLRAPSTRLEDILDIQSWPGRHDQTELARVSPIVYVSEKEAPPAQLWQVIGVLASSGLRVRRLGAEVATLHDPAWAAPAYPLVAWSGTGLAQWRSLTASSTIKAAMVPAAFEARLALPRLLSQVLAQLPAGVKTTGGSDWFRENPRVFSPDTLRDGAFDTLEMSYLGAAGRSTLQTLTREGLRPREADRPRWTFDQLITVRLLQVFKARGGRFRAAPSTLLRRLADLAEASQESQVAVGVDGRVYVNEGDGYVTLETGQAAFETVLNIDEAFRPFRVGRGRAPGLLRPSTRTDVDPRIMGGSPSIRDRRIPARGLAEMLAAKGPHVVRSAFPELTGLEINDGVRVGQDILALRR